MSARPVSRGVSTIVSGIYAALTLAISQPARFGRLWASCSVSSRVSDVEEGLRRGGRGAMGAENRVVAIETAALESIEKTDAKLSLRLTQWRPQSHGRPTVASQLNRHCI